VVSENNNNDEEIDSSATFVDDDEQLLLQHVASIVQLDRLACSTENDNNDNDYDDDNFDDELLMPMSSGVRWKSTFVTRSQPDSCVDDWPDVVVSRQSHLQPEYANMFAHEAHILF
jgi:hypothetical protein